MTGDTAGSIVHAMMYIAVHIHTSDAMMQLILLNDSNSFLSFIHGSFVYNTYQPFKNAALQVQKCLQSMVNLF